MISCRMELTALVATGEAARIAVAEHRHHAALGDAGHRERPVAQVVEPQILESLLTIASPSKGMTGNTSDDHILFTGFVPVSQTAARFASQSTTCGVLSQRLSGGDAKRAGRPGGRAEKGESRKAPVRKEPDGCLYVEGGAQRGGTP